MGRQDCALKKVEALLDYCRYEYNAKQRRAKFDAIGAGHTAALVSMGVIQKAPDARNDGPELPGELAELYGHYRRLKFSMNRTEDGLVLIPRDQLGFADVAAYCQTMGASLEPWEVDTIMGIDGIFEGRENG